MFFRKVHKTGNAGNLKRYKGVNGHGICKDIKDLKIDASLGKEERILSYLEQMENPYEYQDGDTRVRIRFSDTEKTLTDQLISYISEKTII